MADIPAVDPLDEVRGVFTVMGMTGVQSNGLINVHNITGMDDFSIMRPSDADKMVKIYNSSHRTMANMIGLFVKIRLEGFLYWYHDQYKRGITPNGGDFDADTMKAAINDYNADKVGESKGETDFNIDKIQTGLEWWTFKETFVNMTKVTRGADNDPLYYIIRPDKPEGWTASDEWERRVYQLPQSGPIFDKDNEAVWSKLVKCAAGTTAWEWLKEYENTRDACKAWKCLILKCEGTDATNKRVQHAQRIISTSSHGGGAVYTNEYSYSFEKYSTKLQMAYRVLAIYENDVPTAMRVHRLLEGMNVQGNPVHVEMAKAHITDNLKNDWDKAVSYMSAKLSIVFPPKTSGTKRKDGPRRISEVGHNRGRGRGRGRGGRGGRGRGRGGRGGRGGRHNHNYGWFNGVDCTNPKRNFSEEEWEKMGQEGRKHVRNARHESNDDDRNVSQAKVGHEDGQAIKSEDDSGDKDDGKNAKGGKSGLGFGRGAYSQK